MTTTHNSVASWQFCIILFRKLYISFSEHCHLSLHLWLQFCSCRGKRERESQILVSCHVGCANSFLVNSFFASLFFPRCTRHCQEFSRCVFVVVVSRLSRFTYTFLTRPHAWLIWSERVGSKVTELSAVINVIRVCVLPHTDVCLSISCWGLFF